MCAGLQSAPRIWARCGFGRPLNTSSLGRTQSRRLASLQHVRWRASPAAAARRPRRSSRCGVSRRFQLARSLVRPAALPIRRVRPNQALQRAGSVRRVYTAPPAPAHRRSGRPLNTSSLGAMADVHDNVERKVKAIFHEMAGARADRLFFAIPPATGDIAHAAERDMCDQTAFDVAFHLSDWTSDAAFLLAAHLFPERFTREEIAEGVDSFLLHAPNHVAAAAKLSGHPISDIFEVGSLVEGT